MKEPLFSVELNAYLFGMWISITTPQWNREYHLPSWYPKWQFDTIDDIPCSNSKWFHLDWFFHLAIAYGPASKGRVRNLDGDPPQLTPAEREELERLCEEFNKGRREDGGVWPEYTGDSR